MEKIKKYKKILIIGLFILMAIIATNVSAADIIVKSVKSITRPGENISKKFPYYMDGTFLFFCIERGMTHRANLPEGYDENTTRGEWCPQCNPTGDSQPDELNSMEYNRGEQVDLSAYQDAAYVINRAGEAGRLYTVNAQRSIWYSSLNLTSPQLDDYEDEEDEEDENNENNEADKEEENKEKDPIGEFGLESEAYNQFYKTIHNGNDDIYSSKISDKTVINNVKVEVDQNNKNYIAGPFTFEYPKGEYIYINPTSPYQTDQKWSYITEISLLNQDNAIIGTVSANNIHIINSNGDELRDTINDNNYPEPNQEFYVKFSANLGDSSLHNIKLKVDFKYLESCTATLQRYYGKHKIWSWMLADANSHCPECGTRNKTWKLYVKDINPGQTLVAFQREDRGILVQGQYEKEYRENSLIVAPGGVDLTMKISGQVFLDKDSGKVNTGNNMLDSQEELNGVEVVLYDSDNNVVTRTNILQKYHVHNTTCYTNVPHQHTGNPQTGGGCYTAINHIHTGSSLVTGDGENDAGGPGTCYTEPIYHVHTGDPNGKVTTTEHHHIGDTTNGGPCYQTPVYHQHGDGCYSGGHQHTDPCYEDVGTCTSYIEEINNRPAEGKYRCLGECREYSVTIHERGIVRMHGECHGGSEGWCLIRTCDNCGSEWEFLHQGYRRIWASK